MRKYLDGETYAVKDILKSKYGAKWEPLKKQWYVDRSVYSAAQSIINDYMSKQKKVKEEEKKVFDASHVYLFADKEILDCLYSNNCNWQYIKDRLNNKVNIFYFKHDKYKESPSVINEDYQEAAAQIKEIAERKYAIEQKAELREQQKRIELEDELNCIENPYSEEKRFIYMCCKKVVNNELIIAELVHKYRSLYDQYEEYFKLLNLPDCIRNKNSQQHIIDFLPHHSIK